MVDNSSLAYPADYYYPEFIYSRADEPPTSPPLQLPLAYVDNGIGSSTTAPTTTTVQNINETQIKQPIPKQHSSTRLASNVVTNQGLSDNGMTQTVRTDPKTNLLRNPAERNIPKLIVDDSIIQQTLLTSKSGAINYGNDYDHHIASYNQMNNGQTSVTNSYMNGDLLSKSKLYETGKQQQQQQQPIRYTDNEQQSIDDYWKREVFIDDQGVVTIEPVVHDEPKYEGPFGLTRRGSYIFYIGMGIFTLIAAIFLIMSGVFYAQNYPDSSTNAGKLAGVGICAFAFYLGLQLILIGIWHQKHRKETAKPVVKSFRNDQLQTRTKSTKPMMEDHNIDHNIYDFQYQPQVDYSSYGTYPSQPYAPYGSDQMLIQGAPPGTMFYPPAVWPPNDELGVQPDPKFYQPMEMTYGQPTASGITSTSEQINTNDDNNKNEKKSTGKKSHKKKNAVEVDTTKEKTNSVPLKSSVIEPPLPRLDKAPETKELIEKNAELEKNLAQTPSASELTEANVAKVKGLDDKTDSSSVNDHQHHQSSSRRHHRHHNNGHSGRTYHPHRHHHRTRHHRRRDSYSPCSICSRNEFYSDVGYDPHHHNHHHHHAQPVPIFIPPPPPTQTRKSTKMYRDNGVVTDVEMKITKDSSVTADLQDVSFNNENDLSQIPIIHRTVIVEPYPAEPSSQIIATTRTNIRDDFRLNNNDKILYPRTPVTLKKSKKNKNTTESTDNIIEELNLEDVNENGYSSAGSKKKRTNILSLKKSIKNAFYN